MIICETEIRVRYADTDQMHFVYNGKYLEYFEVGRTEMLRDIGLPYDVIEKEGFLLPVLEANVKYKLPAYYDDILIIKSLLKKFPDLKIHIDYEIVRKNTDEIIAEGFTVHAFMNKQNKKVTRPPEIFAKAVKKFFPEVK
jgi:acyl-CoA thioester hydrolase